MNETGNKYALAALKDRRASIAGEITATKKRLDYLHQALGHVDATLKLFACDDPAAIGEKKAYKRVKLFGQGELNRLILDALRRSQSPLGTAEIVASIIRELGHEEGAARGMQHRVRANLQYLHRDRRLVLKHGTGRDTRWSLASSL